ncbi:hypothetical protein ACFCWG_18390 [Streptomyces sp. NPDC056390]|uniref:hypothetical protein n=1 Tax=Streptomyces sp. NPDC056390 TaxID=3345806 RepID=UPI0035DF80E2
MSKALQAQYAEYQASLKLRGLNGLGRLTARNYDEHLLKQYLQPSATAYLADLSDTDRTTYLAANPFITWSAGKVTLTWDDFLTHVGARKKSAPAFDAFDLLAGENNEFGAGTTQSRHFTECSLQNYTSGFTRKRLEREPRPVRPASPPGTDRNVQKARPMMRTIEHDRTPPPTSADAQRGFTATVFTVLRRHRGTLAGATARVVGLSGLTGLLTTAAIFALAWPVFTRMRNQRIWYHHVEDPYLHDHTDLGLVALGTFPLFLLLLGAGSAALQSMCSGPSKRGPKCPRRETGRAPRSPRDCDRCSPCTCCVAWPYGPCRYSPSWRHRASPAVNSTLRSPWPPDRGPTHSSPIPRKRPRSSLCCCASRSPSPRPPRPTDSGPARPCAAPGR